MSRTKKIALIVWAIAMVTAGALQLYETHQREIRTVAQKEIMENLRRQISELEREHKGPR